MEFKPLGKNYKEFDVLPQSEKNNLFTTFRNNNMAYVNNILNEQCEEADRYIILLASSGKVHRRGPQSSYPSQEELFAISEKTNEVAVAIERRSSDLLDEYLDRIKN